MNITVEIPDWASDRHIYVFAGVELLAFKHVNGPLYVKEGRCSMCGKCCKNCEHLKPDGKKRVCGLALKRPFCCGTATVPPRVKECTESFGTEGS